MGVHREIQLSSISHLQAIELNTRRGIPYLQAAMHYFFIMQTQ